MARLEVMTVRVAGLRSSTLTLAKPFSIGLNSAERGGGNLRQRPR